MRFRCAWASAMGRRYGRDPRRANRRGLRSAKDDVTGDTEDEGGPVRHRRDPDRHRRGGRSQLELGVRTPPRRPGRHRDILVGRHDRPGRGEAHVRGRAGASSVDHELARLFAWYVYQLQHEVEISDGYRVLAGVVETLSRLMDRGVVLGIVSGGLEGSARNKLERGHLNRYFPVGAFGTDYAIDTRSTRVAIARVSMMHGRDIGSSDVIVVGDTPLDVDAAEAVARSRSRSPVAATPWTSSDDRVPTSYSRHSRSPSHFRRITVRHDAGRRSFRHLC